jgi:5S rRNA maturation endonuclease (ribonuclease M5)
MLTQGATYKEAVDVISEYGSMLDVVSMRNRGLAQLDAILNPPRHNLQPIDITPYMTRSSWWWTNAIPYGRFHRDTVRRFCLGYDGTSHRAVIPISHDGKWVAIMRRAVRGDQQPRYLYTKDFDRRHVLYGLDTVQGKTCVVVEGAKDCLRLREHGIGTSVAALGTALTQEQLALIADRFDEVTVFCDNDPPGHMAQFKMCKDLAELVPKVFVVQWRTNRKDPNELSEPAVRRMLERRVHWTALVEPDYDPFGR